MCNTYAMFSSSAGRREEREEAREEGVEELSK
jgi:hypothetical protein